MTISLVCTDIDAKAVKAAGWTSTSSPWSSSYTEEEYSRSLKSDILPNWPKCLLENVYLEPSRSSEALQKLKKHKRKICELLPSLQFDFLPRTISRSCSDEIEKITTVEEEKICPEKKTPLDRLQLVSCIHMFFFFQHFFYISFEFYLNINIGSGLVRREHALGSYDHWSVGGSCSWISWSISQSFAANHYSSQLPWRTPYATIEDVHSATHCFVAYLRWLHNIQ